MLLTVVEMPFRILPVFEVDGTKLCGSINILRYLGAKFGKNINLISKMLKLLYS